MSKPVIEIFWRNHHTSRLRIILLASPILILVGLLTQNGEFVFAGAMMLICIGALAAFMVIVLWLFRKFRLRWK